MSAGGPDRVVDADFDEIGEQRRADRRGRDRRGRRLRLDPLFALTLLNHVAGPQPPRRRGYPSTVRAPDPGLVVNLEA
jgi:hypothetical protein